MAISSPLTEFPWSLVLLPYSCRIARVDDAVEKVHGFRQDQRSHIALDLHPLSGHFR